MHNSMKINKSNPKIGVLNQIIKFSDCSPLQCIILEFVHFYKKKKKEKKKERKKKR
jgi:hypothetical protein